MKNKQLRRIFSMLLPKRKLKEIERLKSCTQQALYSLMVHPHIIALATQKEGVEIGRLLFKYRLSIEASIVEAIEIHKDQIGYEPFKNHANVGGIFCDDFDKDNPIYVKLRYNLFYINNAYSKYAVEMLELKTISLDEYLDHYNDGLKSGMIPKGSK